MRYLEENYRKTTVYTDYHRKLENRQRRYTLQNNPVRISLPSIASAPHIASAPPLPERPITPIIIPDAIPLSPDRPNRACSPIIIPPEYCTPL